MYIQRQFFSGVIHALIALAGVSDALTSRRPPPAAVSIPPKPVDVPESAAYSLKVRPATKPYAPWQTVPLYQPHVEVINITNGAAEIFNSSMAYFDFDGAVEILVTPNPDDYHTITTVQVRPLSYGIESKTSDGEIFFSLSEQHRNVVVEVNGDVFNVLHLWTNFIEKDPITEEQAASDSNIIYYGPGYHSLDNGKGVLNITSGQTLYLAGGALLHGSIHVENGTDVTIRGRGMIYKSSDHAVVIEYSNTVLVDGISVLNPGHYSLMAGSSQSLVIRDFRAISAVGYGDGIDLFCMQDVLLERAFLRTSDDCIAIYQHRWNYYGNSSNITVRDSSLWADVAHPIEIGLHGNPENPETMDGLQFHNIDILDHREPQIDYEGCIAITAGDENTIQNILFNNIRVEDFRLGMLLAMRIEYNPKYNSAPGRGIKNVTIRDLDYNGQGANTAIISGFSPDRSIDFVDFQNLTINGEHIWDGMEKAGWYLTSDYVPMIVAANANNITFSS